MLSFDAVSWSILQVWVTLGWEFEHSETGVDIWTEETRMTRLLALSHSLSRCHTCVCLPFWEVFGALTSHRTSHCNHKSPCLKNSNKRNAGEIVLARPASLGGWMRFSCVKTEKQRLRGASNMRAKWRMRPAIEHVRWRYQ